MNRALKITLAIILLTALAFNIYIIVLEENKSAEFIDNLPYALIPVTGSSMEPKISAGDAIFTKQVPFHTIKIGDVILFYRDGDLVTHEVTDRTAEVLITRGTSNETTDFPVSPAEYKAKVLCAIPLLGSLWRISASPVSFVIFALLVAGIIFGKDIFEKIFTLMEEGKAKNRK